MKRLSIDIRFVITSVILLLLPLLSISLPSAQAQTGSPNAATLTIQPGNSQTQSITVLNNTGSTKTFTVDRALPGSFPASITVVVAPPTLVNLLNNASATVSVQVNVGSTTPLGTYGFSVTVNDGANTTIVSNINVVVAAPTFSLSPLSQTMSVAAGGASVSSAGITLTTTGVGAQTFTISTNAPAGWSVVSQPSTLTFSTSGSSSFTLQVAAPGNASSSIVLTVTATRQDGVTASTVINVNVTAATATPTPTNSPVCPEGGRDPGNDFGNAKMILVDTPNNHGICSLGDEDWFKFAAIGGKVYTPDITRFDAGLDLSLELYDADGNRLAFNDDYFARTPQPTAAAVQTPLPTRDIAPRIQSWRAPVDGIYYVRVRDTANAGGGNRTYTFVVFSESYGPTPQTVTEICRDLFEEDGLPEEAKLITSNEIQRGHVLCPTGDSDWVKFFGKTGKTYYIYTDTRPYRNNPSANPSNADTEAGADTVIFLADRDGVSIIDFNDDIESPEGSSTDSQVRFVPRADGFYFAQVKNTGDIGNQFIRYDLVLTQCVPGRDNCGRASNPVAVAPTAPAITQTPIVFNPTLTLAPTSTSTTLTPAPFLEQGQREGFINGPLVGFVDPAFEQVWSRTDRPIAQGRVSRSWIWGPRGLMARAEAYLQSAGGIRQVQYFDKGRMELGDSRSTWFVTSGLLSLELIGGRMQVGDNDFVQRGAADIPIAGDSTDTSGPTYASFAGVVGQLAGDRSGSMPLETIERAGQIGRYSGPQRSETRLERYIPESQHNIAGVFWQYLNSRGIISEDGKTRDGPLMNWVFTMGYPVSEPFWAKIRVGGQERMVLVQVFERRVLTYDPANPRGWRVEMGNIGRHYYRWRYGEELPGS